MGRIEQMTACTELRERFRTQYGSGARVFRAPGRVNLIGEHTDYNDGFVLPMAIGLSCWMAAAPRTDRKLVLYSEDFAEGYETKIATLSKLNRKGTWMDYPVGVAVALARAGLRLGGASLLIHGEVPMGAGLSSSAAVEVATALALVGISGLTMDRKQLARICQRAEFEFVGMRCGIMDQFVACHAQAGHALLLDCRSLGYEFVPLPEGTQIVVCSTMVKHELANGEYNRRRADCEEAVQRLSSAFPGICALRDVTSVQLERNRGLLSEKIYRRVKHVVEENARVQAAARALRSADLEQFGCLMAESHASLRDSYEVSCPELDLMVELAGEQRGVFGSRMTGGGFGGSTVHLVDMRHADEFRRRMAQAYETQTGKHPETYLCAPAEGASEVTGQAE